MNEAKADKSKVQVKGTGSKKVNIQATPKGVDEEEEREQDEMDTT